MLYSAGLISGLPAGQASRGLETLIRYRKSTLSIDLT